MLTAAHRLSVPRLKAWLRRRLIAAGSPNYYTAEEYLALSLAAGVVLTLLLEVLHLLVYGQFSLVLIPIGLVVGAGISLYNLYDKAAKRVRLIARRVPYALDLIALAMGAGATFAEAARTVSVQGEQDDPFNVELRAMLTEMDLGATRRRALMNLSERIPLDSLRSIVASVVQAEELGTPLSDVLHDQATLMRLRRSYAAENRAAIASVRIPIACIPLVFAVLLAVFGPAIVQALRGGLL
jgi:tight adherence protein C